MTLLAVWLAQHKNSLVSLVAQNLSSRPALQEASKDLIHVFLDRLIEVDQKDDPEPLNTLLRDWVLRRTGRDDQEPLGLLPVLGTIKRVIWGQFQADPPAESPLVLAARLNNILDRAAELAVKIEATVLLDEVSHSLIAQSQPGIHPLNENERVGFMSVVAHELKTPLTVIEGYTSMLKMDLPDTINPRVALMVQGIESGMLRLRELVQDMIDVSLIEMHLLNLEMQPVWLRRLMSIAEFDAGEAVRQRNLKLEIKRETLPAAPTVGDPEWLLKVFHKILANAIKYTPDGGQITVSCQELAHFVDIIIEDSGIGIAPENLERIFEKYPTIGDVTRHSSGKTKFKGGGPGLGLVIARGIMEAHGGTVWAESPGLDEQKCPGSRFHLLVPMVAPPKDLLSQAAIGSGESFKEISPVIMPGAAQTPPPEMVVSPLKAERTPEGE